MNVYMCVSRFGEDAMEVMESLNFLFRKFHQLNISNEEYSCLKTITLLNQGNTHTYTNFEIFVAIADVCNLSVCVCVCVLQVCATHPRWNS